ncbi:hypothetical protein CEXT_55421 [Caerostris extrusa]|uniref:Uncharacterized protein n=1 Tax=Caerostris extrusa TaxID=172846 RepID=A0AAV4VTL7_CAEEX|nr:hypothetical protein CEXT_55421 [Caerostris extrusa]
MEKAREKESPAVVPDALPSLNNSNPMKTGNLNALMEVWAFPLASESKSKETNDLRLRSISFRTLPAKFEGRNPLCHVITEYELGRSSNVDFAPTFFRPVC